MKLCFKKDNVSKKIAYVYLLSIYFKHKTFMAHIVWCSIIWSSHSRRIKNTSVLLGPTVPKICKLVELLIFIKVRAWFNSCY